MLIESFRGRNMVIECSSSDEIKNYLVVPPKIDRTREFKTAKNRKKDQISKIQLDEGEAQQKRYENKIFRKEESKQNVSQAKSLENSVNEMINRR